MASIQCSKCKEGIRYHGEPKGIEYTFFKKVDWEKITSSHFESFNKRFVNNSITPMLFQSDTIEIEFPELIIKAWKCPKCGSFIFFNEESRVTSIYEENDSAENKMFEDDCNYVVFDDYTWDKLTNCSIPNHKITTEFKSIIYASIEDSALIIKENGKTIKQYKKLTYT